MTQHERTDRGTGKLSASDYEFLREMLDREVGILLEDGKEYLAVTRLEPVMKSHDIANLTQFVDRLRKQDRALKSDAIDAMTVNETLFFRDPNVWNSLRQTLLPELIEANASTRKLRIWSAASSSGQEPYSLSIVLSELLGKEDASWDIKILASDLSREMVSRTGDGIYSNYEVSRGMEKQTRDRFFVRRGEKWQANERLRGRVSARQVNLSSIPTGLGPYDLIMLRNVLIYFSADTRESILRKMPTLLTPTGNLLLGASEGAVGVPSVLVATRLDGLVAFQPAPPVVEKKDESPLGESTEPTNSVAAKTSGHTERRGQAKSKSKSNHQHEPNEHHPKKHHSKKHHMWSRRSSDPLPVAENVEPEPVAASTKPERELAAASAKPAFGNTDSAGQPSALDRLRALREERERLA